MDERDIIMARQDGQRDAQAIKPVVQEALAVHEVGRVGPVGKEEVAKAEEILKKYKAGKANLEARIIDNEQWFKIRHWEQIGGSKNPGDPEPASAWLLNCILNKHADAMDNYPEPNVLPREEGDKGDAELLSNVLPVVLEQCDFEQTYSDMWWYKLKAGTGVLGVFWSPRKNNGLGDIDIRSLDMLNLFWEPGITDIQKSRNIFHVDLVDREILEMKYPFLKGLLSSPTMDIGKYVYDDTVDTTDKAVVVDWYYKSNVDGKDVVHICKFCNGEVLYASENDENMVNGFYDHGKYPFVFDTLFPVAGTPAGFGYIDVCKSPQMYIDKLDQVIIKHAVMGARPRFFLRGDGAINENEYSDWTKDFIHYQGSSDPRESIIPVEMPDLSDAYLTARALKVDELKETSGNRDFSQGGTSSGVTAASAIAALQEAGSKLSRDMIKSSYRSFAEVCYLALELMRQFYREDRWFRVVGKQGEMRFMQFNGAQIAAQPQGQDFGIDMGMRVPVFDIKITSQKSSPFSTVVQNERAKELYGMGFFRPDLADQSLVALEMMDFEGIEAVREKVALNGTLLQQVQMLQGEMMKMATIIDSLQGTTITQNMAQAFAQQGNAGAQQALNVAPRPEMQADSLGQAKGKENGIVANAREKAASRTNPQGG